MDPEIGEEVALARRREEACRTDRVPLSARTIITGVEATQSNLAQDEIFGPVLAVIKVRSLDDAFAVANDTRLCADRRRLQSQPGNTQTSPQRIPGRQPVPESGNHRCHRAATAIRRIQDERHRQQSRRTGLSTAVHDPNQHHRKHHAPRLRPRRRCRRERWRR